MLELRDRADGRVDLVETRPVILHTFPSRAIGEAFLAVFQAPPAKVRARKAKVASETVADTGSPDPVFSLPALVPQTSVMVAPAMTAAIDVIQGMHRRHVRRASCSICARQFTSSNFNLETCARCSRGYGK